MIDYQNWYVIKLLGQGAIAKVFLVARLFKVDDKSQIKYYAMKIQNKSDILKNEIEDNIMSER